MASTSEFVFVTCQCGAEAALKAELARLWPGWRFAYSRPGFLTFKNPLSAGLADNFALRATLARSYAISLGCVRASSAPDLARQVWQFAPVCPIDRLHVWSREKMMPGTDGYEPGLDETALEARRLIVAAAPAMQTAEGGEQRWAQATRRGDLVLDCVLVEPDEWWVGYHRASSRSTRWPGGIWRGPHPAEMVSRAYLKTSEALDWMALPIKPGQRCVELGCAPGGSTQALLDRGLRVTGVDPANVDPRIGHHRDFTHVRKRGADLPRKAYRPFQWLIADMNVAPRYTLATVRDIVTHRLVHIRGLVMNLKLADWALAAQVPEYVAEVRSWGYPVVRARQLSHQRQEICVAGLAAPSRRRGVRAISDSKRSANQG